MKHLKRYKLFEDILSGFRIGDVEDILLELQHEDFHFEIITPQMRQDQWQVAISKLNHGIFILSDVQDTLSRLHDYFVSMDKQLHIAIVSPVVGMQTLTYHGSYKEYRNSEVRIDTPLTLIMIYFSK